MTAFKKYFAEHSKNSLLRLVPTVIFALVALILYYSLLVSEDLLYESFGEVKHFRNYIPYLFCPIVAAFELAPFKDKRRFDLTFSLPIGRGAVAAAHYLNGLLHIFATVFVTTLFFFVQMVPYWEDIGVEFLLFYMIDACFLCTAFYSLCAFAFDRANSLLDGIVFEALWLFVPSVIERLIDMLFVTDALHESIFTIRVIESNDRFYASLLDFRIDFSTNTIILRLVMSAIGIASGFGFFWLFVRRRPEKAGDVSNSIFGYNILLPIYGALVALSGNVLALVALAVGYVIFRRGLRLKPTDIVVLLAVALLIFLPLVK